MFIKKHTFSISGINSIAFSKHFPHVVERQAGEMTNLPYYKRAFGMHERETFSAEIFNMVAGKTFFVKRTHASNTSSTKLKLTRKQLGKNNVAFPAHRKLGVNMKTICKNMQWRSRFGKDSRKTTLH